MMQKKLNRGIRAAMFVLLTAVTMSANAGEMRRIVSDYEITPNQGTGIVRAFFYGPNTVIELEAPPDTFSAVDEKGASLEFEHEGRFIRLVDRPAVFTITFSGRAATFRSRDEVARVKPALVAAVEPTPTMPAAWAATATTAPATTAPATSSPATIEPATTASTASAANASATNTQPKETIDTTTSLSKNESEHTAAPVEKWEVLASDQWLSQTLKRWGEKAGWGVSWEARDFPTTFTPAYEMTFEEAVLQLVLGVAESDAPVTADFRDDGKNRIVRIIKFEGNSNAAHQK